VGGGAAAQVLGSSSEAPASSTFAAAPATGGRPRTGAGALTAPQTRLPARLASSRSRPSWLIWLYLVWQALVLLSAGVVLWWRNALKASVTSG